MTFPEIDRLIVFGGARCLAEFAARANAENHYDLHVFTCDRQLAEPIYADGRTLAETLNALGVRYKSAADINTDPEIRGLISPTSLGLGFGEAWSFEKDIINRFDGRLLDLMGIRLPQYRGGAHYTWQILRGDRIGCCNLQIINEEMVQGEFDSGEIVKSREYLLPAQARIPNDYFDAAVTQEVDFLMEFLAEIHEGRDFPLSRVQEGFSIHFPRLYTKRHGLIDWNWSASEIERFICAFDDPYPGASTFLQGERVHLKRAQAEFSDGEFHPFQVGLIYRIAHGSVFIAVRDGSLVIRDVRDEQGRDVLSQLKLGMRFVTPRQALDEAFEFSAEYTNAGLKAA